MRHGDFEVLAVVLDTSAARLRQLATRNVASVPKASAKASDKTERQPHSVDWHRR